jgi:hypothetical protein
MGVRKIIGIEVPEINFEDVSEMKRDFDSLCEQWGLILENEEMKLLFK